jgi:macrolide transport system ATP-binding/permease protein
LRRRPAFALAVLGLLALGLGGTTSVFALFDALFRHPLPFVSTESLVAVFRTSKMPSGNFDGEGPFSLREAEALARESRQLREVTAHFWYTVNLSSSDRGDRAKAAFVSGNYFPLVQLRPAVGRFFSDEESPWSGEGRPVAVLSHRAWQTRFGGSAAVLGQRIRVNNVPLEVIGVAPPKFFGLEAANHIDVFVPLSQAPGLVQLNNDFADAGFFVLSIFGRLQPGATVASAQREVDEIALRLAKLYPDSAGDRRAAVKPFKEAFVGQRERARLRDHVELLGLCSILVLLTCCASLSNLLAIRNEELQRELAIRQAVGSDRTHTLKRLLAEVGLLFGAGWLLSLPASKLLLQVIWQLRPPELADAVLLTRPSSGVALVGLSLTALSGLLAAAGPIYRTLRPELAHRLRFHLPFQAFGQGGIRWGRRFLLVAQLSLVMVSMVAARLVVATLEGVRSTPLGFEPENLLVATVAPGDQGLSPPQAAAFYDQLLAETRALPSVSSAALAENRILRGGVRRYEMFTAGSQEPLLNGSDRAHRLNAITPEYFRTVGIPLVAGRDFSTADRVDGLPVLIVNRALAEAAWPGQSAVGQRLHLEDFKKPPFEVVGVVENSKVRQLGEGTVYFAYQPALQTHSPVMTLHVRTANEPGALLATLRATIERLEPGLPLADALPMTQVLETYYWLEATQAKLASWFAGIALGLALLGVYGVVAHSVQLRRHELGVRQALGATPWSIVGLILGEVALIAGAAVVTGWVISFTLIQPFLQKQFPGIGQMEIASLGWQLALLGSAALLGSLTPAHRAARVPPRVSIGTPS